MEKLPQVVPIRQPCPFLWIKMLGLVADSVRNILSVTKPYVSIPKPGNVQDFLQSEKKKRGEIEWLRRNETCLWYLREVTVQRVRVEDSQVSGMKLILNDILNLQYFGPKKDLLVLKTTGKYDNHFCQCLRVSCYPGSPVKRIFSKCHTIWGGRLSKMFCNMFSGSSPCLLGQ